MSDLLSQLSGYLTDDNVASLSRNLGASPEQTQSAIGALLPTLVGALARKANDPAGQEQLSHALERDHDGSILDHLGGFFSPDETVSQTPGINQKTTAGGAILDHILGGRKDRVGDGVGRASGLSSGQSMKLMMMLAPMLMGALGKKKQEQGLTPGGLGDLLQGETRAVEQSSGGGMIANMLDQDGDGDFDFMDVMKLGAGKLFGRG